MEKNKIKSILIRAGAGVSVLSLGIPSITANELVLKYDKPAQYFEEALVAGNGTLGATIYGGTMIDRISLNDITLWTGEPEHEVYNPDAYTHLPEVRRLLDAGDYVGAETEIKKMQGHYSQNYQPLGNLRIDYGPDGEITDYKRQLDISNATVTTQYKRDRVPFEATYFVSAPDSVIVIRLTSGGKGVNATLRFDSLLPYSVSSTDNGLNVAGYTSYGSVPSYVKTNTESERFRYDPDRGIHFNTALRVLTPKGGSVVTYPSGTVKLVDCPEAEIIIANATSFNGFDKDPVKEGRPSASIANRIAAKASARNYADVLADHVADYKKYFDRVSLDLGSTDPAISALTTDKQLRQYRDLSVFNPDLEELYFQFGRYLLISCSRTSGVPANLQGLWNEYLSPPWSSNYTSNINLEENYWPACVTNLEEMQVPLLEFIKNLSVSGKESAKAYCGVDCGWVLCHNTDIWAMTCPVGAKSGSPNWANWYLGGAWVATHIWEHYQFTQDRGMLAEYYPMLKGAAEFCIAWLVERDGKLMTSPGTSPENQFIYDKGNVVAVGYGTTSDLAMIRECLVDAADAARTLGVDKEFVKRADATLKRLSPYKIGAKGSLQEWYYDWEESEPGHRHQSHLFGLYPGHHISVAETPELAKACERTLELRGDKTTGWSSGWRMNLQARLKDGEKGYGVYRKLLSYISPDGYKGDDALRGGGTYPNLLDAHSPFQIDGNFGGTAGVAEMLLQSTPDTIELLPALPSRWSQGSVKGLRARGGYTVDIDWADGKVTSATIYSATGGKTTVSCNGRKIKVNLKPGASKTVK